MAKKILYVWTDLFNDEVAVKCASGCWPKASTDRWYSVTDVERRLTRPPLVASSDCSRCPQQCSVPLVTQENTKEMLTAIDTVGTSNETLAQFQARTSR